MGFGSVLLVILVVALAILINLPPPPLSQALQGWRSRGEFFKYEDYDIFFIDEKGMGKDTILCLHGFPTSSYDWIKVLPGLKEQFGRIVLLDFLGFGFSDKPISHPYLISEQADIVEHLSEMLQLRRVHILSHDYGDTVALELLARQRKLINAGGTPSLPLTSLIMLNGGIFLETHHPRPLQKFLSYPVLGPMLARLTFYQLFRRGFSIVFGQTPTEEELMDFYAVICYKDGHIAMAYIIDYLRERKEEKERYVGALHTSFVPVVMVYGPADPVNPPEFAARFREVVPHHKLVELSPEVGHYPQWEDPNAVLEALTSFRDSL